MSAPLLTYDRFEPGRVLRSTAERVDDALLAHWRALYPHDQWAPGTLPLGLATVLLMRAYMRTLSPRPPGNMHARQQLRLHGAIGADDDVVTEFECVGKEIRRERRYVDVAVRGTTTAGRLVFDGRMSLIWAA